MPTRLAAAATLAVMLGAGAALSQTKSPTPAQQPQAAPKQTTQSQQQPQFPDWRPEPRYRTLNLRADFQPDPQEVPVDAGGDREATSIRNDCLGWIDFSRPDVDVNYESGQFPLYISAVSQADTTIVVNDPQGNWHCNDDFEGLNPGIVFRQPRSGNYNIWVGTFERGRPQNATVRVSEILPAGQQQRR